jgi:hypothetical protein
MFCTRYKEHIRAVRNNVGSLGYSSHILNTGHAYGSVTNIMTVMKVEKTPEYTKKKVCVYIYIYIYIHSSVEIREYGCRDPSR